MKRYTIAGEQGADDATAQAICQQVDGLPLALRLVGRYLNQTGETATEYRAWLEQTPLEALDPHSAPHRLDSVPRLLQRSVAQLSQPAQALLALLGQLALAPVNPDVVREALKESQNKRVRQFLSEL